MQEVIDVKIENMIYEIRGAQVMLDSDLARIYKCTNGTKDINKAVKRNIEKFPNDFYFQLTEEEVDSISLRFQIGTLNNKGNKRGQHIKYLPYVFTEQGVAMLATVVHTKVATEVSISIMRAFVRMRHFILENQDIYKSLNTINNTLIDHNNKIDYLFSKFDKKEQVLLKGQTFEAYTSILDILNTASNEVIIVDNYANICFLDLIKDINCNITLITRDSNRLSNIEIDKYNMEYHNLKVIRNNDFHDRVIVIDNKEIYLLGTSLNNIGEKTTLIVKINDINAKEVLFKNIKKIVTK